MEITKASAPRRRASRLAVLGPVAVGGTRNAELLRTLRVLMETNGNAAEAARRLHYHDNTCGTASTSSSRSSARSSNHEVRLTVQLALQILEMPLQEGGS